jgi:hypothetical protein
VRFSQALLRTEMRSLASLFGVSLAVAVGYALLVWANSGSYTGPTSAGVLAFQFTFLFGLIPVAIYGAPLYAWMQHRGLLTWPKVVILGAVPGAVSVPFSWSFGVTALACGVAIACLTHGLAKQDAYVRSNKSLERTREG